MKNLTELGIVRVGREEEAAELYRKALAPCKVDKEAVAEVEQIIQNRAEAARISTMKRKAAEDASHSLQLVQQAEQQLKHQLQAKKDLEQEAASTQKQAKENSLAVAVQQQVLGFGATFACDAIEELFGANASTGTSLWPPVTRRAR